jgi:hypothetical protein
MIENVPALVCTSCGTRVFPDTTADVFERIRDDKVGQYRMATMLVFDYDRAVGGNPPEVQTATTSLNLYGSTQGLAVIVAGAVQWGSLGADVAPRGQPEWKTQGELAVGY